MHRCPIDASLLSSKPGAILRGQNPSQITPQFANEVRAEAETKTEHSETSGKLKSSYSMSIHTDAVEILAKLKRELYAAREDREQAERMVLWATRRLAWLPSAGWTESNRSKQLLDTKRMLEKAACNPLDRVWLCKLHIANSTLHIANCTLHASSDGFCDPSHKPRGPDSEAEERA